MDHTWIELDLDGLAANIAALRASISPNSQVIFVVKSDAYGHGLEPTVRRAAEEGITWFDVAHVDEAVALRKILPDARILVSGAILPEEAEAAVRAAAHPIVVSRDHAASLAAGAGGAELSCHVMVDTGMGRLGVPWEEAAALVAGLADMPGLRTAGICTHFASSDGDDRAFADKQAERFNRVLAACAARGVAVPFRHISNSGAVRLEPRWDLDAVRAGLLLYGYGRVSGFGGRKIPVRPWLQWKTRVVQVRHVPARTPISYDSTYVTPGETNVAVIDAGYADGYSRRMSNTGSVLVGGQRRAVLGRVTMNLTVVDLGRQTVVRPGDEVVLLGCQGDEAIWADEIAAWCGTIPYEALTSVRAGKPVR